MSDKNSTINKCKVISIHILQSNIMIDLISFKFSKITPIFKWSSQILAPIYLHPLIT